MTSKWPSKKELDQVLKKLDKADGAKMLPPDADDIDRFKFKLCEMILIYKQKHNLSNEQMGLRLEVDATEVSKIVNYHIDRYTIDKLYRLAKKIMPNITLDIAA